MTCREIWAAGYAIPSLPEHWFIYQDKVIKCTTKLTPIDLELEFPVYSIEQIRASMHDR